MRKFNLFLTLLAFLSPAILNAQSMDKNQSIHQFEMESLQGVNTPLSNYKDKVVLIVNVASKCGLTPQYVDLQETYDKYKDQGLVILGFPANNFGAQEPGSDQEIENFCRVNYGVTFPMFSKISVKGDDQHPLYQFLTQKEKNGILDAEMQWNFQKFLVGKDGRVLEVISPTTKVDDPELLGRIEALLN